MSTDVGAVARGLAVRTVKPLVSDEVWRRLSGLRLRRPTPAEADRRRWAAADLTTLAQEFGTDKWGHHFYTPHYDHHFGPFRRERIGVLEVGIGGYAREKQGGRSLRMWKAYFPHARIVGLDIEDKSHVDEHRIRTVKGSQADPALLRRIASSTPDLQIVIDDGSHRPEHIRASFAVLFPLLPAGGLYAIEDTQTSYWPEFGGAEDRHDPTTTMALVKDLVDGLNYEEYLVEPYEPTYADRHVVAVHCYHNLVIIEKGENAEGSRKRTILRRRYAAGGGPQTRATTRAAAPPSSDPT